MRRLLHAERYRGHAQEDRIYSNEPITKLPDGLVPLGHIFTITYWNEFSVDSTSFSG